MDSSTKTFIDTQNTAYLFLAKKHTEGEMHKLLVATEKILVDWKSEIAQTLAAQANQIQQSIKAGDSAAQTPCLASDTCTVHDSDYPVGSIISVSVVCSAEEGNSLFTENGPRVNTILNNVYIRSGKDANTQQAFHWADGNEIQSEFYAKLPGEWRSRGVCGNFNGSVVSCKYYLAQRTA